MMKEVEHIIDILKANSSEYNRKGMARFGITTDKALGVSVTFIRQLAKEKKYKRNHQLALDLWATDIHEARVMATIIDDPKQVTEKQMEEWVICFNSWDLCDQCCMNLFQSTPWAFDKALEWADREEEYVRRAGFVLMARIPSIDKTANHNKFEPFWQYTIKYANDERNFVKKAVNWTIRQMGKTSHALRERALEVCSELQKQNSRSAKWIAADAIRELNKPEIIARIKR